MYSLILGSQLPTAKKFKHWVTSEVLPSIRKHGAYITDDTLEKALTDHVFDAETVAKCLGISTVAKSGNECVRWNRVNDYLKTYSPDMATVNRGDFIPEQNDIN